MLPKIKSLLLVVAVVLMTSTAMLSMSSTRTRQIQQALIKHGYKIQVTGNMDKQTVAALKAFQKAHNWQRRIVPDARALQELGLGPHYPRLLNADTAWLAKGSTFTLAKGQSYAKQGTEMASNR